MRLTCYTNQAFWVVIFHKLSVAVNIRFFRKLTEASLEHVNISVTSEKNAKVVNYSLSLSLSLLPPYCTYHLARPQCSVA